MLITATVISNAQETRNADSTRNDVDKDVVVKQSFVDDATKCFDEAVACRDTVQKFLVERASTEVERQAAKTLIQGLNDLIGIKDRQMKAMQDYIDFLEKRLNKKKSTVQKILDGIKEGAKAAFYILIGRGLAF